MENFESSQNHPSSPVKIFTSQGKERIEEFYKPVNGNENAVPSTTEISSAETKTKKQPVQEIERTGEERKKYFNNNLKNKLKLRSLQKIRKADAK